MAPPKLNAVRRNGGEARRFSPASLTSGKEDPNFVLTARQMLQERHLGQHAQSLDALVNKHGVQLRRFPPDVFKAMMVAAVIFTAVIAIAATMYFVTDS